MPDWLSSLGEDLSILLMLGIMLVGLFGLVIPIFPGGIIIWLVALAYGVINGVTGIGVLLFALITLAMIAGLVVDDVIMARAARKRGVAWRSLLAAFLGGILGTIVFPPFGGLLASPLLLFLSEYLRDRDRSLAWQRTRAVLVGWGWSFAARFGLGFLMITFWSLWVLINPSA
jgi:hypothetical protein